MYGRLDKWIYGWIIGWTDGWVGRWMDGGLIVSMKR
jgi:hypothetical protein